MANSALLTTTQFCKKYSDLGLTVRRLDDLIKQGKIPAIKEGEHYKVWTPDVRRWYYENNKGNRLGIERINKIFDVTLEPSAL